MYYVELCWLLSILRDDCITCLVNDVVMFREFSRGVNLLILALTLHFEEFSEWDSTL